MTPSANRLGQVRQGALAVFINSSDGFSDCWEPFFTLFSRYGDGLTRLPIYLNTERRDYCSPRLKVFATKAWPLSEEQRPTWSECLKRGLESIAEPYVLYLQEDYFLKRTVDATMIERALARLTSNQDVGVVYLNRFGPLYKQSRPSELGFIEIAPPCRYLASTQAAIWRKDFLLSLLREWENGWMFEIFASRRAAFTPFTFLTFVPEVLDRTPIMDYVYTGVMKGKWNKECLSLFERERLNMDFSQRGFYQESGRFKSRIEVAAKLLRRPMDLLRSILSLRRQRRAFLCMQGSSIPVGGPL